MHDWQMTDVEMSRFTAIYDVSADVYSGISVKCFWINI